MLIQPFIRFSILKVNYRRLQRVFNFKHCFINNFVLFLFSFPKLPYLLARILENIPLKTVQNLARKILMLFQASSEVLSRLKIYVILVHNGVLIYVYAL